MHSNLALDNYPPTKSTATLVALVEGVEGVEGVVGEDWNSGEVYDKTKPFKVAFQDNGTAACSLWGPVRKMRTLSI